MNVTRKMPGIGDLIFIDARHEMKPALDMYIRRVNRLRELREAVDLAELPEYLSDEDPYIIEAAKRKLDELTESKGCLKQMS